MRRQAEHRIRKAAGLARPGWLWAAAVAMNAPTVAVAAALGWYTFTAENSALATVAGVLFGLVSLWAVVVILDSWRVLRRFIRRASCSRSRGP